MAWYNLDMILNTRGRLAKRAVNDRHGKGLSENLGKWTRVLLSALDAATTLGGLTIPPGNVGTAGSRGQLQDPPSGFSIQPECQ